MPPDAPTLVLGRSVAITAAQTAGVPLFARCPPAHSIILGAPVLEVAGRVTTPRAVAVPAGTPHRVRAFGSPTACVAYLDARRYRFEDAQRLAVKWERFVPGQDDLCAAFADALRRPRRRVDERLLRALEVLEQNASVGEAATRAGLSESRLTHLMTASLGSPPRAFRRWFTLQRALGQALFEQATLTQAAHHAGFADSAHFTRTCKQLAGVRPAQMLPRVLLACDDDG